MDRPSLPPDSPPEALTSIPSAYTLSCTPAPESQEVKQIIIQHFLHTLAEISLSIASRQNRRYEEDS